MLISKPLKKCKKNAQNKKLLTKCDGNMYFV
jgi:hypothetical protein